VSLPPTDVVIKQPSGSHKSGGPLTYPPTHSPSQLAPAAGGERMLLLLLQAYQKVVQSLLQLNPLILFAGT
jgi:hypothetical protein